MGVEPGYYDGICDDSMEDTVRAVTDVANVSMDEMDGHIVDVILAKTERRRNAEK